MSKARLSVPSALPLLLLGLLILPVRSARGQDSTSAALAEQLLQLMTASQLDAAAAKDTIDDDRYVAALVFPGQILVVSARYEVPLYVDEKIENRQFREVYIDLNTASIAGTKILITDVGANGLLANDAGVDMFDDGSGMLRLDGSASQSAVADADEQYARMLTALIDSAR